MNEDETVMEENEQSVVEPEPEPVVEAAPPPVVVVDAAKQYRHDEMLREYNELQALHMKEASESDDVLEKYLHMERTHAEVLGTLKKAKPVYVYAPDECRPVPKIKGAVCDKCGWTFGGLRTEDKEPHVTA